MFIKVVQPVRIPDQPELVWEIDRHRPTVTPPLVRFIYDRPKPSTSIP